MSYLDDIPSSEHIRETLSIALSVWGPRNDTIRRMRDMLNGKNAIVAPANTQYTIRTMHTYMLTSVINEKTSRFAHQPSVQVIPAHGINFDQARAESTRLELAITQAFYEMERKGNSDVWSKVVWDSVTLDEGVERVERAPAAFWPELDRMQTDEALDDYKKERGLPIRTVYVPLERFYPIYEGPTIVESFEIDIRSLRSVKQNALFNQAALGGSYYAGNSNQPDTLIPIVMHCNQKYFSYWALPPQSESYRWDSNISTESLSTANPILLHVYPHDLGRIIYNNVPGRYGGWRGSHNAIEGINQGLLELNQNADELVSQVLTNARARYWPTLVHKVDFERRGIAAGSAPKPIAVPEGQNIAIFKDEDISPIFKAEHDEAVVWLMDVIREQMGKLGGSSSLFGMREPGVDTGYHQALQLTQAEHLDEKIEQNLVQGAIQRATILCSHVKAMNSHGNSLGKVWTSFIEEGKKGKAVRYLSIDPKDLSPMPVFAARVRKPRPVDFVASMRAALTATDERGGKGPLLSDDTARAEILGRDEPDVEEHRILVEQQKRALISSGALSQRVLQKMNLLQLESSLPDKAPDDVDPMLAGLVQGGGGGGAREGEGGGMPPGQSQPEAVAGFEEATLPPTNGAMAL